MPVNGLYVVIWKVIIGGWVLGMLVFLGWLATSCAFIPIIPPEGVATTSTTSTTSMSSTAGQSTGEIHQDHVGDDFQR